MNKEMKILNFEDRPTTITILDFEDVLYMIMHVYSGDENLEVVYKNGRCITYDSSEDNPRIINYDDGSYIIHSEHNSILDNESFINRKTSYEFPHIRI